MESTYMFILIVNQTHFVTYETFYMRTHFETEVSQKWCIININTSGNHRLESAGLDAVKGRYWGGSFFYIGEITLPYFTAIFPKGRANSSESVDKLMINHWTKDNYSE